MNTFLSDKRINVSSKSSYLTKVHAAVIRFNFEEYLRTIKKLVSQTSPGIVLIILNLFYNFHFRTYSFLLMLMV